MKKLILMLVFGVLVVLLTSSMGYTQNDYSFVSHNNDSKVTSLPVNELSTKALRHFNQEFSFAQNESWFKIRDGYTVKFEVNDIQYRIGYNNKGNWLSTVKIYHEPELNQAIRHIVKSSYYDYTIGLVEELTLKNNTTYVIHIDNDKEFKKLYLSEGEMTVMEEFSK
jgi:hypothetical protein